MTVNAGSLFWFIMLGGVLPGVLVIRAFRSPSRRQMQRWAERCGVIITPANEELIRSHLGRVRRYRSAAAFPFWWLYPAPILFGPDSPLALGTPVPALAAYMAGAVVAEVTIRPTGPVSVKQASLSPRTVQDFLPGWIRVLPWVSFAITIGLLLAPISPGTTSSRTPAINTLGAATGFALVAELATRRIVNRPQRGGDADVLAADDGLRATAVSMTAGVAVLAGLIASSTASNTAFAQESWWSTGWWMAIPLVWSLLTMALSVGVLSCIVRQETWGYRRRHRQAVMGGVA